MSRFGVPRGQHHAPVGEGVGPWHPEVGPPSIERMAPGQWRRVRAVRLRALRDAPDAFWTTPAQEQSRTAASWRAQLGRDDRATFIATLGGADVGIAVGAPHHDDATDAGVYAVWVAPPARGRGVGGALLSAVIDWAAGRGFARLRLDVADDNRHAVALYERFGFMPTGAATRFPPPRDHVLEHERVLDLHRT